MNTCDTLHNASEKQQGFRKLKGVMTTALLGATVAAAGVLSSAEPAQAGGRYHSYRSHRPHYSRVSYGPRYYAPRSYRRCARPVRSNYYYY
ncbi:hypothetical protein [Egbenema bharatensis]|uniref:hypothetical protein n=1 Tax=Egbenema bharatensis TaxID=3463334 RepID=UPI003A860946